MKEDQMSAAEGEPLQEGVVGAAVPELHQDDGHRAEDDGYHVSCDEGGKREEVTLRVKFQNNNDMLWHQAERRTEEGEVMEKIVDNLKKDLSRLDLRLQTHETTLMGKVMEDIADSLKKDVFTLVFKCAGEEIESNCLAGSFRGKIITVEENALDEDISVLRAITKGSCSEKDNSYLEGILLLPKVNVNKILDLEEGQLTFLHCCILNFNARGLQLFLDHPEMRAATVNTELLCGREAESRSLLSPLRLAVDLALDKSSFYCSEPGKETGREAINEYGLDFVRLLLNQPGIKTTNEEGWSLFEQARWVALREQSIPYHIFPGKVLPWLQLSKVL